MTLMPLQAVPVQRPSLGYPGSRGSAGAEQSWTNSFVGPFEDDGAGQSYTWVEHPFEDDGAGQSFQPFPFVPFEG